MYVCVRNAHGIVVDLQLVFVGGCLQVRVGM